MFSYRFNNSVGSFKIEFPSEWERFHTCNAAIWYGQPSCYDKWNANGRKLGQTTYVLVSYATPIAIATEYTDYDYHTTSWYLRINEEAWNCSPTTIRQLARFLGDIKFPYIYGSSPYQLVKACMQKMERKNINNWYVVLQRVLCMAETTHNLDLTLRDLNVPGYYVHSI